ncbi:MAG TPA: hypothetical protein VFN80_12405 [Acidothermaceae bacterium]|nr:hypothetical protein [Acidothermaceae bacterium]
MTTLPHGVADLYLAPVVIALDERIDELGRLDRHQLAERVALESNRPDWSREDRQYGLIDTIQHLIEVHSWQLSWDDRGVRLTHGDYSIVLGVPQTFYEYVDRVPGDRPVGSKPTQPA